MKSVTSIVVATCAIVGTGVHAGESKCEIGLYVKDKQAVLVEDKAVDHDKDDGKVYLGKGSGMKGKALTGAKCNDGKIEHDSVTYEPLTDSDLMKNKVLECTEQAEDGRTDKFNGKEIGKKVLFAGPATPLPADWSFEALAVGKVYLKGKETEPLVFGSKKDSKDFEKLSTEASIKFNGDKSLTVTPKESNKHLTCSDAKVSGDITRDAAASGGNFCTNTAFLLPNYAWMIIVVVLILVVVGVFMMGGGGGDDDDSDSDDDKDDEDS